MSCHIGWVSRMGLGFRARVIVRAIISFFRGVVVGRLFWRSFESWRRSWELAYSYIFVVVVFVFCVFGWYCPSGVILPMSWVFFWGFFVCLL